MFNIYFSFVNGLWDLLIFLIAGALIGYIAALFFGSKKGGLFKFLIIGIIGSYIGALLSNLIFDKEISKFMNYIMAVIGSGILIFILRALKVIKWKGEIILTFFFYLNLLFDKLYWFFFPQ